MGFFESLFGDSQAKREKQRLVQMLDELNSYLYKVNNAKTLNTRLKNCDIAIQVLQRMRQSKYCDELLENSSELNDKLHALKKTLPVIEEMKKAHKNQFKKKVGPEKNNLLNALYEITENNITDEDFIMAEANDDETGVILSESVIRKRLKELGWEE